MTSQRLAIGLAALNLALLVFIVGREARLSTAVAARAHEARSSPVQDVVPVLRGRALELVDEAGQVRSRINVEPDGEVVFRLIDRKGTIRVKLGAGERGSGLLLLDEATEPAVHVIARRTSTPERPTTTSVTLRGSDGELRVIRP
jgi:hypothetical protein